MLKRDRVIERVEDVLSELRGDSARAFIYAGVRRDRDFHRIE
ncbi:MAG: hypothetical protein ACT4P4_22930 [Betaproteobacteria bacterium]